MLTVGTNRLFGEDELKQFENLYDKIIQSLVELNQKSMVNMDVATRWMETVSNFNIPRGKQTRSLMVASAYKVITENAPTNSTINTNNLELAFVLDWTQEFYHKANLITNNIMENRATLNGNPTWHNLHHVGMMAVNDSIILKEMAYNTMKIFFEKKPNLYNQLEDLRRNACDKYVMGRGLYEKFSREGNVFDCTLEKYRQIIDLTVGYISFYLPVIFAIKLGEEANPVYSINEENYMKKILLDIAFYHQLECDYDKIFSGNKTADDMTESDLKLNWFFIKTIEHFRKTDVDSNYLLEYAQQKNVSGLRKVFTQIEILNRYSEEKALLSQGISTRITIFKKLTDNTGLVKFLTMLAKNCRDLNN